MSPIFKGFDEGHLWHVTERTIMVLKIQEGFRGNWFYFQ